MWFVVKFFPLAWTKWPLSSNFATSAYEPPPTNIKEPAWLPPKYKSFELFSSNIVLSDPPLSFHLNSLLFSNKRFPLMFSAVNWPKDVIFVWAAVPNVPTILPIKLLYKSDLLSLAHLDPRQDFLVLLNCRPKLVYFPNHQQICCRY